LPGGPGRIVWAGSRSVNCKRHPRPETVWPVRIEAGAFGGNVPARDLYLSPDHAVFVNGVLVPIKLPIDGSSFVQVKRSKVSYHHVELERHDVILAEGLAVESYLDTDDSSDFGGNGAAIRLFPDFTARLAEVRRTVAASARSYQARPGHCHVNFYRTAGHYPRA
jgi:collagen type I/II/III/V/XI/XXIV/XXVII alpha